MKSVEQFVKEWEASPELKCNLCGVIFKGNHECDYEKLKEKVKSLQNQLDAKLVFINNEWEEERYVLQDKVERYETVLKEISLIHNYDGFKAKDIAKIVLED